jgi:hypothetical protein
VIDPRAELAASCFSGVAAVRRPITTFALALLVAGCGASRAGVTDTPAAGPIELLTGVTGCYAGGESSSGITGALVPDPNAGTAINGTPIMWPVHFTARRAGSEVEVLDEHGKVLATTGRTYHLSRGPVSGVSSDAGGAFPAAANCPYVWDFMDCTLAPGASPSYEYKSYCGYPEYWVCITPAPSDKYCRVRE